VDPTQVDVNVHPRKTEIRFANEQNIFRSLYHIIQERLDKISLVSQENMYFSENTCEPKPIYENICEPKPKYNANS
jgi:DNA mismatch repair ATPase MutL